MHNAIRNATALRRELIAGSAAGLLAGGVFAWAMQEQGMTVPVTGLAGSSSTGAGVILHLLLAAALGAGFGGLFRYQAGAAAATVTFGLLYGLLWWIVGPLTLRPLLMGDEPRWSLAEATAVFPSLVGHLLYGGLTAMGFYALVTAWRQVRPERVLEPAVRPVRRVVILGGGFGGLSAAQRLEQLLAHDRGPGVPGQAVEVTLVSQSNYLLFTPMLAEVASSGLEAQHISAPVRAACPRTRFRRADVEAIDTERRTVDLRAGTGRPVERLPYDELVLALGSVPNYYGLPGLAEHSFTLKTLEDATLLRNHLIAALEHGEVEIDPDRRRRMLTFVVAGAGFAGTELIAELFDLARGVRRFYPGVAAADLRFVLVHSGDRILPELSPALGAYALQKLRTRGIEVRLGVRVAGATAEGVRLNDGSAVPAHTVVWTAGNQPNPLLRSLPCERNRAGQVVADQTLAVEQLVHVWAVGDCAEIPDAYAEDKPCPPTAQHALRQGKLAAENIVAALHGARPKPFRFRTLGVLVALGRRSAAAEIRGRQFSGLLAWLMWRSIYLSKLPGLEKKVRVALDWTVDLFFPRDIVLTTTLSTPTLSETMGAGGQEARAS